MYNVLEDKYEVDPLKMRIRNKNYLLEKNFKVVEVKTTNFRIEIYNKAHLEVIKLIYSLKTRKCKNSGKISNSETDGN